jgi:hypothetical protein
VIFLHASASRKKKKNTFGAPIDCRGTLPSIFKSIEGPPVVTPAAETSKSEGEDRFHFEQS